MLRLSRSGIYPYISIVLSTYMPACSYIHACMFLRRHVVLDVLHQKRAAHAILDQAGYAVIAAALLQ